LVAPCRKPISVVIDFWPFYPCRLVKAYLRRIPMLKYAIIFVLISLVAGAFGFGGVAAGSAGIAKILFGLFLILAVIFIVLAALGVGAVRKVMK
jgi:uncharacterized membrane protein YtjA (UPF0391 family)